MRSERGAIGLFIDWPDPGRTLPRLIPRLGADAAAQLYEAFVDDLVVGLCGDPFDAVLYAASHPEAFRARYPGVEVRSPAGRSEGRRLHGCFDELLATNVHAAVLRSRMPDLHPRLVRAAFEMLERRDAVLGPTERGDFYFLAMREPRDIFRGIRWGSPGVAVALHHNLRRAHLSVGFLPMRRDVEGPEDVVSLAGRIHPRAAPLTYRTLRDLGIAPAVQEVG
jgi:hypothetical protein